MTTKVTVCKITISDEEPLVRIEGDYIPLFYDRLKHMVPKHLRGYYPSGPYWLIDARFFCRIFEAAWEYFTKIHLIENGRAEEYTPGK